MANEEVESYNFIDTLFDYLLKDINKCLHTNANKEAVSANEVYMLCKVIAYEYRDEVRKNAMEGQDLTHLKDLPQLFVNYFGRYPLSFSSDIILWTIARFLSLLSCTAVYRQLGGLYRQLLLSLSKFLSEDSKKFFFKQIILLLFETLTDATQLTIKICDSDDVVSRELNCDLGKLTLSSVEICLPRPFEKKAPLQLCLLELMQHGCFDFNWLDSRLLHKTWLFLIRMTLICDFNVKSKVLLVIQRLLTLDLCNSGYADLLLYALVSVEKQLSNVEENGQLLPLQESLTTCEQTFGRNLRKFENLRMFKGLTVLRTLEWMAELTHFVKQQECCEMRAVHFIADFCFLLARSITMDVTQSNLLKKIGTDVSTIVDRIFEHDVTLSDDELGDLFSFMLTVDSFLMQNELQLKIVSLGSDTKECSQSSSILKAIRVQHLIISALKRIFNGVPLLSRVIPQTTQLIQILRMVPTMVSGSEEVLLSLTTLISTLVDCYEADQPTWLAFLSLPWLVESIDISRHKASIPLLPEMRKIAKTDGFAQSCTLEVKRSTIAAMSKMQFASEWRRILFTHALDSSSITLQRSALENFPYFVASIDSYAYKYLLDKILCIARTAIYLKEGAGICATVFKAIAHSICVLDTKCIPKNDDVCSICAKKAFLDQRLELDLKNFYTLLQQGFLHEDKDVRLACCTALQTSLKHVHFHALILIEDFIGHSLVLMKDVDEDVRVEYEWCLIQIVHMRWTTLFTKIGNELSNLENVGSQNVQLQYTVICAEYAIDEYLSSMCFLRLILLAIASDISEEAVTACEGLIQRKTSSCDPTITPRQLFLRYHQPICKYLAKQLVGVTFLSDEVEDENLLKLNGDVDAVFKIMAHLFGYTDGNGVVNVKSLLRDACCELVPSLIVASETSSKCVELILRRIMEIRNISAETLVTESFSSLLVHLLDKSLPMLRSAFRFIEQFTIGACNWRDLMSKNIYDCTVCLLQHLSVSEERCMQQLKALFGVVREKNTKFSLTGLIEERYLGILLRFRPSFSDDRFFSKRSILVSSLCKMIRAIKEDGTNLLDTTAQKMLAVLRAASQLGEMSVPAFAAFVETLSDETLVELLPRILVSIAPLLNYEGTADVLRFIFESKGLHLSSNENFERISIVMWDNPKISINEFLHKQHEYTRPTRVLSACASLLKESSEEVCELVLLKILQVLSSSVSFQNDSIGNADDLGAILVPALFRTIQKCTSRECRNLACLIFGRLSAIDPGRIGLSVTETAHVDRRSKPMVFVDAGDEFFVELLEKAAVAFAGILDATIQEECSYSIQMTLRELMGREGNKGESIWNSLSKTCAKELALFRKTNFTQLGRPMHIIFDTAIIDSNEAVGYMSWMSLWYLYGAKQTRDQRLKTLFEALFGLVKADAVFARFLLPHVILEALIEDNSALIIQCENEMIAVLRKALSNEGWLRLSAHVVFSILDCLERFIICRKQRQIPVDNVRRRCEKLLLRVLNERLIDGTLLAVVVAEKCHCITRALKWCEQYGIQHDEQELEIFDKAQYFALQRIYSEMDDLDGVLGAFATIKHNSTPTIDECILAFEANGDYLASLPLYQLSDEQKLPLVKCFLRLNQPYLALSTTEALLQSCSEPALLEGLRACQLEATWRLKKWTDLDRLVDEYPQMSTWGATTASLLCSLKHLDVNSFSKRMALARSRLVDALTAMTIEGSDTYAQAYRYITRLHILSEMEEAKDSLNLFHEEGVSAARLASVLKNWQDRSALVMQCTSILEPIYTVRRGLLRLLENDMMKSPICDYLLHSCRMSRLAGQLQVAWTFLVEAKALNVNHFDVAMEEARFLFEKGNQSEAVDILSKLLKERFVDKMTQMQSLIGSKRLTLTPQLKETLRSESKEEKANFVKVQLLLADFCLKAGACNLSDLYSKYVSLPWIADPSEDLFYRVAIFLDNYLYSKNENLLSDKVTQIVEAYIRVLSQGKTHLFHVLPRMLTIWLDNTQKKTLDLLNAKKEKRPGMIQESVTDDKAISELNNKIRDAFNRLGHYTFYTAFAQLISRITHPNEEVFSTLKIILAELMVKYPHQCLWQSIAVFRSDAVKQSKRYERCRMVYELARRKDTSGMLKILIAHYEYTAASFIRVAEDSSPSGTHASFSRRYSFLANFFKTGETDKTVRVSEQLHETIRPQVVVPLREMIEHGVPVPVPNSLSQFPVEQSTLYEPSYEESSFINIYIESIEEEFTVMRSMVRPKKITIVASDGNHYALMCKAKDELRKDGRLMDINRMVNALLHQNADARRRQLFVRTYNVVPLQDAGGLIEWIPHLKTYRTVLEPLMNEKCENVMSDKEWFSKWIPNGTDEQKLDRLRKEYYPRHPVVMAEWFRRMFPDASKWYAARLAFVHTSAVMSIVGFVLGLGDRHGENLLIDVKSGDAFHVDFNLLFNKGEYLTVPEVVPFRLTRNIVNGFGVTGVEGAFRKSCETTMQVLREKEEVLYTVLQTFVHDPLLEWMHAEARAQQIKQRSVHGGKPTVDSSAQQQAREAIEMIRSRLRGNIVSPKIYRNTLDSLPMSVEGQVGKLIQLATDELNLARMYIGWCPFL